MRKSLARSLSVSIVLALTSASAFAAATNTYQVTGPVLEVRDDAVVVQKGKEKWEISRSADTKIEGDLKVGNKVTIEYRMAAAKIEVKGTGKAKADKAAPTDNAPAAAPAKAAHPAANPY